MHSQWVYDHLRLVQVRTLHLRQLGRAVLSHQHLPDLDRLFELRPRVRNHHQHHHLDVDLPGVRQARWAVLLEQQLQRSWHAVPFQQCHELLLPVQALRSNGAGVLLQLVDGRSVPRLGNGVQQQHQYLPGLWRRRQPVLRRLQMHGRQHRVQHFAESLRRVRHSEPKRIVCAVLPRQPLQRRLLRHPLRRKLVRQPGVRRGGHELRQSRHQHDHDEGGLRR